MVISIAMLFTRGYHSSSFNFAMEDNCNQHGETTFGDFNGVLKFNPNVEKSILNHPFGDGKHTTHKNGDFGDGLWLGLPWCTTLFLEDVLNLASFDSYLSRER